MALAFVNLGASAAPDFVIAAAQTSYATASWTPPTSGLIICGVYSRQGGGPPTPTLSGNSLTWTQIATLSGGNSNALSMFGADASGSTTGATTIDFAGNTQDTCGAVFCQVTGVDLTGGVAAAFVQTVSTNDTGTSITLPTMAAAGDAANRPFCVNAHIANTVVTPRTNWTELDDMGSGSFPAFRIESEYRGDQFETVASASWSASANSIGIASEIKASVSVAAPEVIGTLALAHTGGMIGAQII